MKKKPSRLALASETVRKLEQADLAQVQGGLRSGEDCTITSSPTTKITQRCTIG